MPKATRKKQAVTKTNNAKTIALIRKNAENSPLLRLPSEVREKILTNLVGDKLIHIKFLTRDELTNAQLAKDKEFDGDHRDWVADPWYYRRVSNKRIQGAFRHAICVAEYSEHYAYVKTMKRYAIVPSSNSSIFLDECCDIRHKHCQDLCKDGGLNALTVDLNVFGVCRQLYEEANHLLWATNIFSFDDPLSFDKFLGSLNPAQKRNVTGLHFNIKLGDIEELYGLTGLEQWGTALKMPYLNMLRGIEHLHLCLEQRPDFFHLFRDNDNSYERAGKQLTVDLEPILRLRTLLAKNVTVIMTDIRATLDISNKLRLRWSAEQKKYYGESIRTRLQDPNGREVLKAEIEARKQQTKLDHADSTWRWALWAESKATGLEFLAKKALDQIETYEDKVEGARKDAMRAASKKSKAADGLQALYEQSKLDLKAAEFRATDAIDLAEQSRASAAMKAAKYQRARARAGDHAAVAKLNAEEDFDTEDDDSSFTDESGDEATEELESMSEGDSDDGVRDSDVQMGEDGDMDNESELSDDS